MKLIVTLTHLTTFQDCNVTLRQGERREKGGGGGDGREEGEGGKVKKEGGKKEGVNVFMLSKKSASLNTGCMPTMHSRWLSDLN